MEYKLSFPNRLKDIVSKYNKPTYDYKALLFEKFLEQNLVKKQNVNQNEKKLPNRTGHIKNGQINRQRQK